MSSVMLSWTSSSGNTHKHTYNDIDTVFIWITKDNDTDTIFIHDIHIQF